MRSLFVLVCLFIRLFLSRILKFVTLSANPAYIANTYMFEHSDRIFERILKARLENFNANTR